MGSAMRCAQGIASVPFLPAMPLVVHQTLVPFAGGIFIVIMDVQRADFLRAGHCPGQVCQLSYLKDNATRARYARTLPSSTFMSNFTISAMRRSRSVPAAVSTAFFAASSQDFVLVPITSTIL